MQIYGRAFAKKRPRKRGICASCANDCGKAKGTVEGFSLRSVRLRHHRGPVYTVPFGQLGAVQNMSRDWVIDKLTVGVTYDCDLDKARKLIKQIGVRLD